MSSTLKWIKGGLGLAILSVASESACSQQLDNPFEALATAPSRKMTSFEIKPLLSDPLFPDQPIEMPARAVNQAALGSPELIAWLKNIIQDNLPETYQDNRQWNKQREVFNGVHIKLDGLNLETHRNRKLVNAGTWTRYEISFVEPEKNLQIDFKRLETIDSDTVAFETVVVAPLDIYGQMAEWARDIKLISLSAHADAVVRLTIAGQVKFQLNMLKLPPDVSVRPVVDQAHVELLSYRVRRISKIDGDAAKVLGKGMRGVIDDKIEDVNKTLVAKINRQIEKRKDKMTFSAQDWVLSKLPLPSAPKTEEK